mgnify:CR=1 FL=1
MVQDVSFAYVTCIFSGASGDAPLYKPPLRSQRVLGESFGSLFADAASLLAGFAALGGMPQGWAFVSMGGVRVRPLALTRAFGGPKMFRNGDANWSPEAAWGQEAAIHEKRAHPKPSAPDAFASNLQKHVVLASGKHIIKCNKTSHHRNTQCLRNALNTVPR